MNALDSPGYGRKSWEELAFVEECSRNARGLVPDFIKPEEGIDIDFSSKGSPEQPGSRQTKDPCLS